MDKDTLLSILRSNKDYNYALFQYCVLCGKDPNLSVKFIQLLNVAGYLELALRIACGMYGINILQNSKGEIIQYL